MRSRILSFLLKVPCEYINRDYDMHCVFSVALRVTYIGQNSKLYESLGLQSYYGFYNLPISCSCSKDNGVFLNKTVAFSLSENDCIYNKCSKICELPPFLSPYIKILYLNYL